MNSVSKIAASGWDAQTAERRALFIRLIMPHERHLIRAARRLCGRNEDRAQDFVQEALVHAYQACLNGRFREGVSSRAWLLRIVTNLYINDYNHRRRWEAGIEVDSCSVHKKMNEMAQQSPPFETPGASLMAATFEEASEQALASLPEKLRLCVILVDLEGLEYAQAARSLGVPVGTIRSRLFRAHLILSGLLEGYARDRRLLAL